MKNQKAKITFMFSLSFAIVLFVSVYAGYLVSFSVRTMEDNIEHRLIAESERLAATVSAQELDNFRTIDDMKLPQYQSLRQRLLAFSREADVLYVYFVRPAPQESLQYIVDNDFNEATRVGLDTPPYSRKSIPWMDSTMKGKAVCSGLGNYTPGWEGLISGYAPVFDSVGNIAAIAGVDMIDKPIVRAQRLVYFLMAAQIIGIIAVFASGVMCVIYYNKEAAQATQASMSKSRFLSRMSHEIRTPMNAIIGITQLQLRRKDLPPDSIAALEKIYNSGSSLLGIINDILDMSKIETGKMTLNPIEYDTPSLINDTVQLNYIRVKEKRIDFVVDIDQNLPEKLFGDELRIKQIVNNLLSNAIKYTDSGRVRLFVGCLADGDDSVLLRFAVEDTGQGIKPQDKELLFSEYRRFNEDANRYTEGTGLGLNITKRLVDMMNGTISVESEYGKGSVFTVTVKQKAAGSKTIGKDVAQQLRKFVFRGGGQSTMPQILGEPMPYGNVLVVDDVSTNLYVAQGLLELYQLNVDTASSGLEAVKKVESGKNYDVIFMDHMMPVMDGIEAMQKLREMGYKGAVVALTANALVGNDAMFIQKGFDGFISKPIDANQLNEVLNKFVRSKHAGKYDASDVQAGGSKDIATPPKANSKLLKYFRGDAQKAIDTLRTTVENRDMKLFTVTAHGMKSALANIGEKEASQRAAELEKAGQRGDAEYILGNIDGFIGTLEALIERIGGTVGADSIDESDVKQDVAYLIEQLRAVKSACENYDDDNAYAALDKLRQNRLKSSVSRALEEIHDALFTASDFDESARMCARLLDEYENV